MIERILIENFKSLRSVDLRLGPLNLFVGTNASGKSNFFDALRVLQGVGNGYTIPEILDGKSRSATSEVWSGIRGGSRYLLNRSVESEKTARLRVEGLERNAKSTLGEWGYDLSLSPHESAIVGEKLWSDVGSKSSMYYPDDDYRGFSLLGWSRRVSVPSDQLWVRELAGLLSSAQHLDLLVENLRTYSLPNPILRMGERGENFAGLVKSICASPETKHGYLSWLREMRPSEVEDVGVAVGAIGEPMFRIREKGQEFLAPSLSDGTLRFAAIAAALMQPDMPSLITIDELENGIHPSRLRLMLEMMRSTTSAGQTQLFATTHSPVVLAWLKPEEYAHTFICKRDDETGDSTVTPLSEVPHLMEVVKSQSLGDLLTEGWLEAVL